MGSWFLSPGQSPVGAPQNPPEHPPLLRVWARSTHGRELPDSLSLVLFPLHSSCRRCKLLHFPKPPLAGGVSAKPISRNSRHNECAFRARDAFSGPDSGMSELFCSVLVSPACVSVLLLTVSRKFTSLFAAEALQEQQNTQLDLQ